LDDPVQSQGGTGRNRSYEELFEEAAPMGEADDLGDGGRWVF
jgi:hypothetical protein